MMNLPSEILAIAVKESPALLDYIIKQVTNDNKPEYLSPYTAEKPRNWSLFEKEIIDIFKQKGRVPAIKHVMEKSKKNGAFYLYFEQKYYYHLKKEFTAPNHESFTLSFSKFIVEDLCY